MKWMKCLILCLLCCSFLGCSVTGVEFQQQDETKVTGEPTRTDGWAETTLFTVNNQETDYREALLFLLAAKEEAELLYGDGIWDYTLDEEGTTYGELRKGQVLDEVINLHIACQKAAELGVDIYEEENRDVAEYTAEFTEKVGREQLLRYNLTEELIRQLYRDNTLAHRVYEQITLSVDTDIPDEEARQMQIQYIQKSKLSVDEEGKQKVLTEEELTALRESMQTLRENAMKQENFASFAARNTDAEETERCIGSGDLPVSVERIVMTLADGDFSPVLESEDSFYLIKCVKAFDEDATAAKKEAIITERQNEMFARTFATWKEQAQIVVNEDLWAAMEP